MTPDSARTTAVLALYGSGLAVPVLVGVLLGLGPLPVGAALVLCFLGVRLLERRMPPPARPPPEAACGFCGKPREAVRYLIAGPDTSICEGCIALSAGIVREAEAGVKQPPGPPPENPFEPPRA